MCVDLPSSENMDKAWRHKNQEIKFCIIDNQRSHVRTRYVYRKHKQMSRLTFLHPNLKNKLAKVVEFFFLCVFFQVVMETGLPTAAATLCCTCVFYL